MTDKPKDNNSDNEIEAQPTRCGFVAVVGAPNVGKSTLVNCLTGCKVSITSPKAQTTRNRIRGIRVFNNSQIIMVDTPGIFDVSGRLNNKLNKAIVETAKNAFEGVDEVALVIDSVRGITENDMKVIEMLKNLYKPKTLILNKIDKIHKEKLLPLTAKLTEMVNFDSVFMVSAKKRNRTDDILEYYSKKLPESIFLYPEEQVSDFPMRMLAAEITREKIMFNLQEEIPYNVMIDTESFEENKKSISINQSIYVISDAHKAIIIGKNGSLLKRIGEQSRREISNLFDKKTNLYLFVKVRENWMDNRENYKISGIDFTS